MLALSGCLVSSRISATPALTAGSPTGLPAGVELYGRLDNMLNRKYEEVLGYPSLPFNFLAGFRLNFPWR